MNYKLHVYLLANFSTENYESDDQDNDFSDCSSSTSDENVKQTTDEKARSHEKLIPASTITVLAFVLCLAAIQLRHQLTKVCISDILKLFALCSVIPHNCPTSYHCFEKYFEDNLTNFEKHHYCIQYQASLNNTENNVDTDESIEVDEVINTNDNCNCDDQTDTNYFSEIAIIPQLENLFDRENFYVNLNKNNISGLEGEYWDIYDGEIYKELSQENQILSNENNIAFMWYTDGIQIFNSSKYSIWGFFLIILQLPYKIKYTI